MGRIGKALVAPGRAVWRAGCGVVLGLLASPAAAQECPEFYKVGMATELRDKVWAEFVAMDAAGATCATDGSGCLSQIGDMNRSVLLMNDYFDNNHDWTNDCFRCRAALFDTIAFASDLVWIDMWFEDRGYHRDPNYRSYLDIPMGRVGIPDCPMPVVPPAPPPAPPVVQPGGASPVVPQPGTGGDVAADAGTGAGAVSTHPCYQHFRGERPADATWLWYSMMGAGSSNVEVGGYLCGNQGFMTFDGGAWASYVCDADYSVNCRPNDYFNAAVTETEVNDDGSVAYHYESDTGSRGWGVRKVE